ncbi:hypothetical protein [Methanococcoides burtonii]|uniref:Uncharacterized protein n=1 Tax=Methanococcoides burtonii (strain DSM 6242 / NBRC 107633 / OCM 468 / ACE-M) TaxID=259564 RepID=Q12WQ5_METBU|nr:hypothetical protein [Methanococcoides burtonii]ABE52121.1 Hypothetical protein Mbur_1198 [Methanococcoides burtonii DSM 6242]
MKIKYIKNLSNIEISKIILVLFLISSMLLAGGCVDSKEPDRQIGEFGELNFILVPEKTQVQEGETFNIHLMLTNVGNKTINVWKMEEQVSYDINFLFPNGSNVPYICGVNSRVRLNNDVLVELHPGQSLNATFNSKCWNLDNGEYILSAVYHTSRGESITKPYWIGMAESNNFTIDVVKEKELPIEETEQMDGAFVGETIMVSALLEFLSYEDLSDRSDVILIGTVKEILPSKWNTADGTRPTDDIYDLGWHDVLYTDVIISVDGYLKNPLPKKEVIVRIQGGSDDYVTIDVEDESSFSLGERVFLYLNNDTWTDTKDLGPEHFVVTGASQGKFTLTDDGRVSQFDTSLALDELLETI